MSYSLDANLLVHASDAGSPLQPAASGFLRKCAEGPEPLYLCWPTVMAYLRIVTHPSIFRAPLSPDEAARNIQSLLARPHVRTLSETEGFWETYRETVRKRPTRGNRVPDAHVAALLRHHGIRAFYTHDSDFRRYDFLDVRDPFAQTP